MDELENKINEVIKEIKENDYTIYFFVIDSNDTPNAGVSNIYKQAKHLQDLGYNVGILKENKDQKDAGSWIGSDYLGLPHYNTEKLVIKPADILIIPEIFASVMKSAKKFPCKKIVMAQNYEYGLEVLEMGETWGEYGFNDVIVTNENMSDYISDHFKGSKIHLVPVALDSTYKPFDSLRKPIILIGGRDVDVIKRTIKSFYLQSPLYSWITFKHVSGMLQDELTAEMNSAAALVWIDEISSFGTLPLEAMACKLPVIGVVPNMVPEWLDENNGMWVNSKIDIPAAIETFMNAYIEDLPYIEELGNFTSVPAKYNADAQKEALEKVFKEINETRIEQFEKNLKTNED